MNQAISDRLELQNTLRQAVQKKQFVLLYQPKLDLLSGRISGMEALLRIKDAERGLLPPIEFIRLAEESGLIVEIGEWVLHEACVFNKKLQEKGLPVLPVAINLSARQLAHYDLVRNVQKALADTGLPAKYLELELTESMLMQEPERVIAMFEQIQSLGVELTIDDFGTGYSSLSYLKRLPASSIKIDRSFVHDLGQDENAASIVKAVISLGHSLGLKVVAEGVETAYQIAFLHENGCDSMQGFLFSYPLNEEEFIKLLQIEAMNPDSSGNLRKLGVKIVRQVRAS
jgi:EAL domain-containing protein (putative c-di-GMP-specific phosphodiesterase class I)